ncbi:30S ribosomal protein S1 [filamentous cyanobacterium CCP5]|nr:30S ribosomal protein S1 [filamentous cyanobacterium CCP5]
MTFSAEDFAKALESHDYQAQMGSRVKGTVVNYDNDGASVDIGGKSTAFLPIREASLRQVRSLEGLLEVGQELEFQVIREQDAEGQVLLSIRRLQLDELWETLKALEAESGVVEAKVTGTNKGGVIVDVEGLRGFVPRSHLSRKAEDLEEFVGQTLTMGLLEVSPATNKLVLSERIAARSQAMGQLELGQLIEGTVASLKPFGVFVEFNGVTGLLHIKQISKNYVESLPALFQSGQPIKAAVIALDPERNRISLSTRVLEKYPGEILKEMDTVMADAENRAQDVSRMLAESDA